MVSKGTNALFGIVPVRQLVGDRFAYVVAGPAGTGKSTLLGSMAQQYKTLLLATLPREAASWIYKELNIDTIPLWESGFYAADPETGALPEGIKLEAWGKYLDVTNALRDDDTYDAIILDNGTELAEIAWHNAMLPHGVISPAYIEGERSRFGPYETIATNLDQGIKNLVSLANADGVKRPKFVGIAWHVQPPREDQVEKVGGGLNSPPVRKVKESSDNKGKGVEYEGTVLPMIRGGFRRKLASQVDAFVFSDIQYITERTATAATKRPHYVIQVQPDEERHAKIPGSVATMKYINNDFAQLYQLVKEGRVTAQEARAVTGAPTTGRRPFTTRTTKE